MTNASDTRRPLALPSELGAGIMAGGLSSLYSVSFAYIIFGGALRPFVGQGIWVILLGALIVALAGQFRNAYSGNIWQPQSVGAVVVGLASASVVEATAAQGPEAAFATVLALLALTGLLTGAFMLLIGLARLGQIAKSVPYPVVGGFLAATGCLLVLRAIEFGADDTSSMAAMLSPESLRRWLPPVAIALLMMLAEQRLKPAVALILGSAVLLMVVHGGVALSGMSLADARAAGLLMDINVAPGGWGWTLTPDLLQQVDRGALLAQYPLIGTAAILAALGALLNLSAIEFSTGEPVELDGELRLAGAANLVVGACGGLVGYHSAALTQLVAGIAPGTGRRVPAIAAATVFGVLLAGPALLNLAPTSLFPMLLAYLGLGFLRRWLVIERARLPREDYLIVLLILGTTLVAGFVWAVIAGVVVASMRFTVAYARVPVLRSAVTAAVRLSSTERSERATACLTARGQETLIFEAQGYMFFGTANVLFSQVEREIAGVFETGRRVRHLVIDLRHVQGVDVSAVYMLDRLARQAQRRGIDVIFTGLPAAEEVKIARGIEHGEVQFFPSLDDALIALEEESLALELEHQKAGDSGRTHELVTYEVGFRGLLAQIEEAGAPVDFHSREVPAGTRIFEMGAPSDSLVVLESGRLYATVRDGESPAARVATFLPGALVGEIGLVTGAPRTATIIAETDCALRVVTRDELDALRRFDPALALALSERISALIARRLSRTTALLHAVSR